MRICFITNFIPPYRKTFYEKLCTTSAHQWLILRGRVRGETGRPDYVGPIDAPTQEVENAELRIGPFTARFQKGAFAAARHYSPDLIVVLGMAGNLSNWLLMVWARCTGRRVVIWACGWEPQQRGSLALRAKQVLMRAYFGLADHSLLYSTKGLDYLSTIGVDRGRMSVCFNGIEIDDLLSNESTVLLKAGAIRATHANSEELVFLYVGGLLAEKRVDLLLEAFEDLLAEEPRIKLWIVGDGPDHNRLAAMADAMPPGSVHFFGRIIDGVDSYFAAANVFILPGIGGLAFNQAMFWRRPCIGSVADGTEDDLVVHGVTGFRFESGDRQSLRLAMGDAARLSEEQRKEIGDAARRIILEQSNITAMVDTFQRVIHDIDLRRLGAKGHDGLRGMQ